jgi:hypothetical protein
MAAIGEPVFFSEDALPVCLWRENPYGLVSLLEMLSVKAYSFISIGSAIQSLSMKLQLLGHESPAHSDLIADYVICSNVIDKECKALALKHTGGIAAKIQKEQAAKSES